MPQIDPFEPKMPQDPNSPKYAGDRSVTQRDGRFYRAVHVMDDYGDPVRRDDGSYVYQEVDITQVDNPDKVGGARWLEKRRLEALKEEEEARIADAARDEVLRQRQKQSHGAPSSPSPMVMSMFHWSQDPANKTIVEMATVAAKFINRYRKIEKAIGGLISAFRK